MQSQEDISKILITLQPLVSMVLTGSLADCNRKVKFYLGYMTLKKCQTQHNEN